jgi:tRNA (cytidine32/uridine32-2'-O)-methyltransferase
VPVPGADSFESGLWFPESGSCSAYGSLNLAAAVQIICYEIQVAHGQPGQVDDALDYVPASTDEMERFYQHLEQALIELDFLDPDNPRQLMRRLRRLYNV